MGTSHIARGVTVGDSAVVTSVLVDGRDVVAAEIRHGWGKPPEQLFGALRAETDLHEAPCYIHRRTRRRDGRCTGASEG